MDPIVREIIRLRDEEKLPWSKIGAIMKMPKSTAHSKYLNAQQEKSVSRAEEGGEGNIREISAPMIQVHTLEELIEFAEIDLEAWSITKWIANYWGNVDNPNSQVKAWLLNSNPIELSPVISPVKVNIPKPTRTKTKKAAGIQRAMVLFDAQAGFYKSLRTGQLRPFHDRAVLDLAVQLAEVVRPDMIVAGGDWLDLADWSDKFARSPNMYWVTQPTLLEVAWWMGQLRQCTDRMVKIEGNHEQRMPRQIVANMHEGYGLRSVKDMVSMPVMSVPYLLDLEGMDIEWIGNYPDGELWLNDLTRVIHGNKARSKSGLTAVSVIEDAQVSTCFGHAHRAELIYKTLWEKEPRDIFAFSPGCMCRIDGIVPGTQAKQNWKQGIGFVEFTDDGWSQPIMVPIANGRMVYEGQVFEARDRLDELIETTRSPKDGKPWPYARKDD